MIAATLLLLLQVEEKITYGDSSRPAFRRIAEEFAALEELSAREPEKALGELDALLRRKALPPVERVLRIEVLANDFKAFPFYPYRLRAKLRLDLASRREGDERRTLVEGAVDDLEPHYARETSEAGGRALLRRARQELVDRLRPLVDPAAWTAERGDFAAKFKSTFSALDPAALGSWIAGAAEKVEAKVLEARGRAGPSSPKRAEGERLLGWCDAFRDSVPGTVRAKVEALAAYRGEFALQISVRPAAEVRKLARNGRDVELPARETPLRVPGMLEIDDYQVELAAPSGRTRPFTIRATDLAEGGTFVLRGDVESGELSISRIR